MIDNPGATGLALFELWQAELTETFFKGATVPERLFWQRMTILGGYIASKNPNASQVLHEIVKENLWKSETHLTGKVIRIWAAKFMETVREGVAAHKMTLDRRQRSRILSISSKGVRSLPSRRLSVPDLLS